MKSNRWFSLFVMAFGSFALGAACDPEPEPEPDPDAVHPLPQRSIVMVEAEVGETWVTLPVPQAGMERLARQYCWRDRFTTDNILCRRDLIGGVDPLAEFTREDVADPTFDVCQVSLCRARNEVCAGFFLEEAARSPIPRVLDTSVVPTGYDFKELLQIPDAELQTALVAGGVAADTLNAPRIRIQPQKAPGRAAALRGARLRYREAGIIGQAMLYGAVPDGPVCVDQFAPAVGDPPTTDLTPPDTGPGAGLPPTWADVYLSTMIDAINQHSGAVTRTVEAMKDSAQYQVHGQGSVDALTATVWNGEVDSALSIANFLGHGEMKAGALARLSGPCDTPARGTDIGPAAVPVCPPIQEDEGAKTALEFVWDIGLAPTTCTPVPDFVNAANRKWMDEGRISAPLPANEVLATLNVTEANVEKAADYLNAVARISGSVPAVKEPAPAPGGLATYYSTVPRPSALPAPVVTAHFTGANTKSTPHVGDPDYSKSGAMQTSDAFKKLVSDLSAHARLGGAATSTNEKDLIDLRTILEVEVGSQRLEFVVGSASLADPNVVEQLAVIIHGVPLDSDSNAAVQYVVVRGYDGLKCLATQSIDGRACDPADYRVDLNAVGTLETLDPRMTDLSGGTLHASFTTLPEPGEPGADIPADEGVYVLRLDKGKAVPMGGIVPEPASLVIGGADDFPWPEYSWGTRLVMAPVGGTLEDVLGSSLETNPNDCSQTGDTCVGLPSDIWPPLESEIVGDPTSSNYDRAYRHWLGLAKSASDEADRLGEEILEHGLRIDERIEWYQKDLVDLCGPDTTACGGALSPAGLLEAEVYATVGDKEVCAWEAEGLLCNRAFLGVGNEVPCVVALPSGASPTEANCTTALQSAGVPASVQTVVVSNRLSLATVQNTTLRTSKCTILDELRSGSVPNREEKILQFFQSMPFADIQRIAQQLRYTEGFADNYSLKFGEAVIFDTKRRQPGDLNSQAGAPCNIRPEDLATGSKYWNSGVECFVSGVVTPPGTVPECPDGVGKDGCGVSSGPSVISLDTEPEALRARWAWGFGRLRRAVATLGVITGGLNGPDGKQRPGMMELRRVYAPTAENFSSTPPFLAINDSFGHPVREDADPFRSLWRRYTTPWGEGKHKNTSLCVRLTNVAGVGSDLYRLKSGRPINFNGFIPNDLTTIADQHEYLDGRNPGTHVISGFPVLCENGSCTDASGQIGVDPQMTYCDLPSAQALATWKSQDPNNPFITFDAFPSGYTVGDASSGWAGASFPGVAGVKEFANSPWQDAVDEALWLAPGSNFCKFQKSEVPQSAVYRALCLEAGYDVPALLQIDPNYMRYGRLPVPGATYVDGVQIAKWMTPMGPGTRSKYGQFLFDLTKGSVLDGSAPFQYPLTQRNIFDALELACHASTRAQTAFPVSCDEALDPENIPVKAPSHYAGVLDCLGARMARSAESYVIGPISPTLIKLFASGEAIPNTGVGGRYLDGLKAQYDALLSIQRSFDAFRSSASDLSLELLVYDSIRRESSNLLDAARAQEHAIWLGTAASAYALAAETNAVSIVSSFGASDTARAVSIGLLFAAAESQVAALQHQAAATKEGQEQKRLELIIRMTGLVTQAKLAAQNLVGALNDLSKATADVKLVQNKARKARAAVNLADFANPAEKKDPQFLNVAMRRIMNTKVLRYESALKRARQLAFLARRAIELRFGVDLQRMTEPMTLAEAPASWANDVCTMQGINYEKIRRPDPEQPVAGYEVGSTPLPGDDFANEYIGDYVRKLEDFLNSYPIDYPLHDSDDTAVISLADDRFRVSTECMTPGDNRLYYASGLNRGDDPDPTPDSVGWYTQGCGLTLPGGGEWKGCVGVTEATLQLSSGGSGLTTTGLPLDAGAFQLRHEPCAGPLGTCPDVSGYTAGGALTQSLLDLKPGTHVASIHALADPDSSHGAGDQAELRIVRDGDGATVAQTLISAGATSWTRSEVSFLAITGERYRLELHPSIASQSLPPAPVSGAPAWPSVFLAAAQVEPADHDKNGQVVAASKWIRTDAIRDVVDPVCHESRGPALRKRFKRRCEYVCADGIGAKCAGQDPNSTPQVCFYEAKFHIDLAEIERGLIIPSGQIAIGNFNYRHNLVGINAVGSGLTSCDGQAASCYYNGFLEYTLFQDGNVPIRNYLGGTLAARMDEGHIEHGKMLAAERVITNPPSSTDLGLMEPYMKHELKGRPMQGLYTLRIWDRPGLRWDHLEDLQLVWRYHYWTRQSKTAK